MKKLLGFLLLVLPLLISAQSKLELYNSAIGSGLLQSLNEEQKAQVTAQLTKNEKLDPAINYYFLKSKISIDKNSNTNYTSKRVSTILVHNNYLNHWLDSFKNEDLDRIVYKSLVEDPVHDLLVNDFEARIKHENQPIRSNEFNYLNYFRLVSFDVGNLSGYDSTQNYQKWLNIYFDHYISQLSATSDSLDSGQNISFNKKALIKSLIIQSVLNSTGNQPQLESSESILRRMIFLFQREYKLNGENVLLDADLISTNIFRLFGYSIGHSFALHKVEMTNSYNLPLRYYLDGSYGSLFKINQTINLPISHIYATIKFHPFKISRMDRIYRNSYLFFTFSLGNPFMAVNAQSKIDPSSVEFFGKNPANQNIKKIRVLNSSINDVKFNSHNSIGFSIPLYEYNNLATIEFGVNYTVYLAYIESQFNYSTIVETEIAPSTIYSRTVAGKPENFSETFLKPSISPHINITSSPFEHFKYDLFLEYTFSSLNISWNF